MRLGTRKVLDRSFTGLGIFAIVLVALALVVLLGPIISRGVTAFVFQATVEHRQLVLHEFGRGDAEALAAEVAEVEAARQPVYDMLAAYEDEYGRADSDYLSLRGALRELLGPLPGDDDPTLTRDFYGQTRWERTLVKAHEVLYTTAWVYPNPNEMGVQTEVPRVDEYVGTPLEPLFAYVESNLESMMRPQWKLYWRFLTDEALDSHLFGGIWAELLGTIYLTIGAILFAVPMGIISAIYLVEYAGENWLVAVLRSCVSTLAGVPSIVFGLFGLAFFINAIHVSPHKSVLAGSLTLSLLILPLVIRASEEAIRAVPFTYKEAALSMGATKWRTILTVILPAALPGILTGVVISMGRAAGETAPIIFTAAVSAGTAVGVSEVLTRDTPALPWNVYNLCTENAEADATRHVQYGMVLTLIALVLSLNGIAIVMRARISRRLTG